MNNKLSILLFLICLCGCTRVPDNQSILLTLANGEYTVVLKSVIEKNNYDIIWKEYGFSYPYILSQELFFYHNGKLLKRHIIPIPKRQFVINDRKVHFLKTPIFDIELLQGADNLYVHLYGANYCCGISCPEFNGLYLLDGTIISECISVMDQPLNGKNIDEIEVDINNPIKRETIYTIFKPL